MSRQKKIHAKELSTLKMVAGNEKRISKVIDEGVVKEWIGFGWVTLGKPTRKQEANLPHVVR